MREFLNKLLGGGTLNDLARMPVVAVTLFGKHPAWGDHIQNLGDDSRVLSFGRTLFYDEGLRRLIDTGAWEKLPPERRLSGFDHFFVWHLCGRMLTGLVSSSTDSHGRSQYPLIIAVETHRRPERQFVVQIQRSLLLARNRCVQATDQAHVSRAVSELRDMVERISPRQPPNVATFALAPTFQAEPDEVRRVLHELRGSSAHLSSSSWSSGTRTEGASALRVRLFAPDASELLDWMAIVGSQIHPAVSLLGFANRAEGVGDLLLGNPTAQSFFCLKANPKALPFTTDIPFEVADGLRTYADELLQTMKRGQRAARTVFGDVALTQNLWVPPEEYIRLSS